MELKETLTEKPLLEQVREAAAAFVEAAKGAPLTAVTCLGLAALYLPTFHRLFTFGWKNADYSHGPLILCAFAWLLWRNRQSLKFGVDEAVHPGYLATLLFGVACYLIGSLHGSMAIEAFSILPTFVGAAGFLFGKKAIRVLAFPAFFLGFLVPPPVSFTDMLTAPLKMFVATASAALLKIAGYAISRNGAVININDYSIIVGDPCSGMRSLIALMAVGALYAHLQDSSRRKKIFLFLSVIPISILANIVRLILLSLITCHLGEAAAEGFLHGFSGFLLFVVSLTCLVVVDAVTERRTA